MAERIIHISDIHFGAHSPEAAAILQADINRRAPDLIIISGDFTQHGTRSEFRQARAFLDALQSPVFCVPGNHDIPHYNLWRRFFNTFTDYRRIISDDLCPVLETDTAVIAGLNTARAILPHWNWAHGRVSSRQIELVQERFRAAAPGKTRILVCHHPLQKAAESPLNTIVWGAKKAMAALLECKIDILMTGHVHHPSVTMLEQDDHFLAAVSASTAISTRLRGHDNGYNIINITAEQIDIEMMRWHDGSYVPLQEHKVVRRAAPPRLTR